MSRRIKAMGPLTARSKSFLTEFAEHGYGMSQEKFNKTHGYGAVCHKRWSSDLMGFREKFEDIKAAHQKRSKAVGPEATVLPASHFEKLPIWQQNFLESWRRSRKRLEAAKKAKVAWKEVKHALDTDEAFLEAYNDTLEELMVGLDDELMVKAYEGQLGAAKEVKQKHKKVDDEDVLEANWWEDMSGIAESLQ